MNPLLNIAIMAARKAGDVMLRGFERLDALQISSKGSRDFATHIDHKAEQEIIAVIHKAYPDHPIIAEESGKHPGSRDFVWHVDPLDGTHNYMRGIPHFCVSIACVNKNQIECGVVYDPIRRELFTASRGQGARLNHRKIRVSPVSKLETALVATGFPVRVPKHLDDYLPTFTRLMPKVSNIRCSGSAALDLAYVAAARLDAYLECDLHSWDMAAGSLLVKEAGGLVYNWQGKEHDLAQATIMAGTPKILPDIMMVLEEVRR